MEKAARKRPCGRAVEAKSGCLNGLTYRLNFTACRPGQGDDPPDEGPAQKEIHDPDRVSRFTVTLCRNEGWQHVDSHCRDGEEYDLNEFHDQFHNNPQKMKCITTQYTNAARAQGPSHLGTGETADLNGQEEADGLAGSVPISGLWEAIAAR
jgi:hypothetical protein